MLSSLLLTSRELSSSTVDTATDHHSGCQLLRLAAPRPPVCTTHAYRGSPLELAERCLSLGSVEGSLRVRRIACDAPRLGQWSSTRRRAGPTCSDPLRHRTHWNVQPVLAISRRQSAPKRHEPWLGASGRSVRHSRLRCELRRRFLVMSSELLPRATGDGGVAVRGRRAAEHRGPPGSQSCAHCDGSSGDSPRCGSGAARECGPAVRGERPLHGPKRRRQRALLVGCFCCWCLARTLLTASGRPTRAKCRSQEATLMVRLGGLACSIPVVADRLARLRDGRSGGPTRASRGAWQHPGPRARAHPRPPPRCDRQCVIRGA